MPHPSDRTCRALFAGSPVKRIGLSRFLRNVLIAIGNSADPAFVPLVQARLGDDSALVRGAAIWALRKLAPAQAEHARLAYLPLERDSSVVVEWTQELV